MLSSSFLVSMRHKERMKITTIDWTETPEINSMSSKWSRKRRTNIVIFWSLELSFESSDLLRRSEFHTKLFSTLCEVLNGKFFSDFLPSSLFILDYQTNVIFIGMETYRFSIMFISVICLENPKEDMNRKLYSHQSTSFYN